MAKTYNTIGTFTAGNVLTAAEMNELGENSNNYRVPPACHVYRSTDLTSYTQNTAITWNAEWYDTDGMFSPSSTTITINTAGIYLMVFKAHVTGSATISTVAYEILVNGGAEVQVYTADIFAGVATQNMVSYVASLSVNDTVGARCGISGGSAYVINGGATDSNDISSLSVTWLGQVS